MKDKDNNENQEKNIDKTIKKENQSNEINN